ncbi:hypothetical protein BDK92_7242 [Micromonospora pisi]|uniref:Uncharacterized protein n=1 Tax=Micromonospora pisi TaxID=589240 RepID=A0A495JWN0_9ACTN|nr:hypothetical protein [Micromonospora pisi]RKR92762.1 hypothetical protein BDK92_7242 [Micromonospora pisi]
MASKSYPRSGYAGGHITELEHERLVHAWAPDGLQGVPSDPPVAYADNTATRIVKLRANRRVNLRGTLWDSGPDDISMPSLAANVSGTQRIDLIVVRLNRADYSAYETVITGTPGQGVPAPLNTNSLFDIPLARVAVDPGVNAIAANRVVPLAWYAGDDGQILCTQTTRPPHYPGRLAYETDTGRQLQSTGLAWTVLYQDTGEVPVAATPGAGWTTLASTVCRLGGTVFVNLCYGRAGTGLGSGVSQSMCQLPAGFRPRADRPVFGRMVSATNGSLAAAMVTASNGLVTLVSHGGLGSTSQVWIAGSFPAAS